MRRGGHAQVVGPQPGHLGEGGLGREKLGGAVQAERSGAQFLYAFPAGDEQPAQEARGGGLEFIRDRLGKLRSVEVKRADAQPQLNAFALPSRDIFVYTGLLKTLPDDDAMLAAVLAHEIAHVTERHSVENLGVSTR